ncbi:ribosome-associated translation inhibitor RaiA [Thermoanaerobacterium thermosaccharolyticum]|uniref:ribosome hibernation-promoting factor, HPF/YfiA family n=1 Tax=Thermoanaerobacterium TaxID=28895 RepID=UPI0026DFE187|nr:ribosome-associated translation inhibitor RaiA [Thermoanaerobacterium sp. CMT5567-10]WHE06676.1 ribosome-associated translation inhibitor RaiA [Thermoanaerobacterium thermosaccharolyticum]WKV09829.1 ribosome-associated translation inhibitor RaiA [Thermoanaerobacterium sp. CMT5567-10]
MRITVSGRNGIMITDGLRNAALKSLSKIEKFFTEDTEARVVLSVQKNNQIAEVTIPFKGMIFRAEEVSDDMYASIDNVVDKLEKQILKYKTKLKNNFAVESIRFDVQQDYIKNDLSEETEFEVVKTKRFPVKPMSVQEAILQMNLLGHNFFVFTNSDTDDFTVVYKRKDGKYGLIEPTM